MEHLFWAFGEIIDRINTKLYGTQYDTDEGRKYIRGHF